MAVVIRAVLVEKAKDDNIDITLPVRYFGMTLSLVSEERFHNILESLNDMFIIRLSATIVRATNPFTCSYRQCAGFRAFC